MRTKISVAFLAIIAACAPLHHRSLDPGDAKWVGCYHLAFTPDSSNNDMDSVRLVARSGAGSGGWTVIPNARLRPFDPKNPGAPTWLTIGDTLVIGEGMLSTLRLTLTETDHELLGTARLTSDVITCGGPGLHGCRDPNARAWGVEASRVPCPTDAIARPSN